MFGVAQPVGVQLAGSGEFRPLRGPLGALVFRPWFDWLALRAVVHWYLPLSRAWATALHAAGSVEAFRAETDGIRGHDGQLARALARVQRRHAAYREADAAWEAGFFGPEPLAADRLIALEVARHASAHHLMATRGAFLSWRKLPPVRWEVAGPAAVEARHGHRLADEAAAFPVPSRTDIVASHTIPSQYGREHWLRFTAPVLGDTVHARVYEPADVNDPPTFIYLHGIAMENEMWQGAASPVQQLNARGFRMLYPEGPWHGRRRQDGYYGGEPVIGRAPLGFIDFFQAWIAEVAALIGWARRTSRGPVVLGGVSLGALTAQRLATAARHWPAELRPDALFLVATCGDVMSVARDGSLTRALALDQVFAANGWDDAALQRWRPLLEPGPVPALPPERILMVLGDRDDLTPFAGGRALAGTWGVPAQNLFIRRQGHFSVSFGLLHQPEPFDRLTACLAGR